MGRSIDLIALQGGRAAYSESSGVTSIPSVLGVGAAITYLSAIGLTSIESHNLGRRNRLFAALPDVPKLRVVSAPPGPLASPLLTFALPTDIKSDDLQKRLRDKHNVQLRSFRRTGSMGTACRPIASTRSRTSMCSWRH